MKILAIETATEACSAALYYDGEIISRYELAPRKHTQLIIPMMDDVLSEAGIPKQSLDAVAFGRGPGAFTGLRIAVGIAQGTALALDKPVVPISSLAAMAQQVVEEVSLSAEATVIPAIDARMGEVYWAEYVNAGGEVRLSEQEHINAPDVLLQFQGSHHYRCGSGWHTYHSSLMEQEALTMHASDMVFPSAFYIAKLAASAFERGEVIDAMDAEPVYLRNDVAKKKAEQGK